MSPSVSPLNAAGLLDTTHLVQLYEDDAFLVETRLAGETTEV